MIGTYSAEADKDSLVLYMTRDEVRNLSMRILHIDIEGEVEEDGERSKLVLKLHEDWCGYRLERLEGCIEAYLPESFLRYALEDASLAKSYRKEDGFEREIL